MPSSTEVAAAASTFGALPTQTATSTCLPVAQKGGRSGASAPRARHFGFGELHQAVEIDILAVLRVRAITRPS
jgi:hypothetical protein